MVSILFQSDAKAILHRPFCSYPRQPSVSSAQTDTYSLLCYYEYLLQNYRACRS